MTKDFIPCIAKQLPRDRRYAAALHAIKCNPANAAPMQAFAAMGLLPSPQRIAVTTSKYFGQGGVHLSVGFMSQASAALQDKILSHMNAWGQYANVKFTITGGAVGNAQVRISLGSGGYYSYLGTDVLQIPSNEQTMNLEAFSLSTRDSEFYRVVRHETGHTLGCPHEHMRAEIVSRLDPAKTIALFEATQGWSEEEIRQQVLTPINESLLLHTPHAMSDSIMCYELPASITIDGVEIPGGTDITPLDGSYIGSLYPLAINPPPPPVNPPPPPINPPPPPVDPGVFKKKVDLIFIALIARYQRYPNVVYILRVVQQLVDQYIAQNPVNDEMEMSPGAFSLRLNRLLDQAFAEAEKLYPQYADVLRLLRSLLEIYI